MVSEGLLLRDRDQPLSQQPFSGCCDTIITKRKQMSIAVSNLISNLKGNNFLKVCKHLAEIAECVAIITETTAQAVFVAGDQIPGCTKGRPGLVDHYPLMRARLAINLATDGFDRARTTQQQTLAIAAVVATHLDILRDQCFQAAAGCEANEPDVGNQFKTIARFGSIGGWHCIL